MTKLGQCLDDYLSLRRAVGFKLVRQSYILADFVAFMDRQGASTVTTPLAVAWATGTKDSMNWRASRLDAVRSFARYLQAIDASTEVPPAGLLPRCSSRAIPYIYDDGEVAALMQATQAIRCRFRRCTYATLIGLLAVTGMRVGEVIGLDRDDIHWQHAVLIVRAGKFGKSREVALHPTTVVALADYSRLRDAAIPHPSSSSFFVSRAGTRLLHENVTCTYRQLVRVAGLRSSSSPRCHPRLCDLRHAFAVRTVLDWYRDGGAMEPRLPLLSTYLGHVDPISTYWYLTATPELLEQACQRLRRGCTGGIS